MQKFALKVACVFGKRQDMSYVAMTEEIHEEQQGP